MTTTKQFWALFKFQTTINPFIWFMPLAFGTPLIIPLVSGSFSRDYHSGFSLLLSNQNMFFIGIFGAMILAPEKFQLGGVNLTTAYYGSEFILTRAIDRRILYRAKVAMLYLLILIIPLIGVISALKNPDLVVRESGKAVQQACLTQVPGSKLQAAQWDRQDHPSLIAIPHGNILIAEWQFWIFLAASILLQNMILVLYPFKHAKWVFWILFFVIILVPLFDLTSPRWDLPTINERTFFSFAANPKFFWGGTAVAFILSQLWCERQFAQLEQ